MCVSDPKPIVECSFVTEFEDHIFVAMDAEAVLFVHDLVINYVKEKDKGNCSSVYSFIASLTLELVFLLNWIRFGLT